MDRLIAIEFVVNVTGEGSGEKAFEILKDYSIEILDHESINDLHTFECRTDSREKYYAVVDALDEAGIDSYIHE